MRVGRRHRGGRRRDDAVARGHQRLGARLQGDVADREALAHALGRARKNASSGWPAGIARCAVRATSVVPVAQTCRSLTQATPGSAASSARTASRSIEVGTPSNMRCSESRNKPQVPYEDDQRDRPGSPTGSSQVQPSQSVSAAATDDAGRDRRVGGHVEEGAAHVQVVVAAAQEEQRRARR